MLLLAYVVCEDSSCSHYTIVTKLRESETRDLAILLFERGNEVLEALPHVTFFYTLLDRRASVGRASHRRVIAKASSVFTPRPNIP